ncbi:glucose-methanol-choline oxidoreductase [Aureobasidium sp. EXF-3400]|nr:glucose-methanol-choline oxidoreductase [Aureobasidium sp. EXF-12344]KAI4775733.1 glucose-methanol-choline oxidoreductase [Aureobasidium sp. EXF-3400]
MWRILQVVALLGWTSVCFGSPFSRHAPHAVVFNHTDQLRESYDYVIAGGGTSGLVVANRLTENPRISVLVIERGYLDGQENGTTVPGLAVPTKYLRTDTSIPQPGLNNRTAPLYTGDVVGGGTVVNGMFFARGAAADYDAWEQLGNPGWGWDGLLPYFKKSETFTPPTDEIMEMFPGVISSDLEPHGLDGPVGSSFSNYQYPVLENFYAGWKSIGVTINPQPNNGEATGAFYSTISAYAKNQSRAHASNAYYRPIAGVRKNLHLITGHSVSKINFSNGIRAVSVDFISATTNETSTVKANREIILAAGAVRTPQILQLSGIGSEPLLSSLGIKTVVDLPGVGSNFQDQPTLYMQFSLDPSSLFPPSTDPSIIAGYVAQTKLLKSIYSSSHTAVAEIAWEGGDTIPLAIIRPSSRGSININTTDPSAAPVIDFNTFSHPIDIAIAIASVKKIREWAASPPMQALGTLETFPGGNVTSDAEIEEAIRNAATSSWQHPTSTTAMMKREWGGVVDAELRVYGTRGLRVVDAGVFPMSVAGHSSSSVYAVAEKAADIIKAAWVSYPSLQHYQAIVAEDRHQGNRVFLKSGRCSTLETALGALVELTGLEVEAVLRRRVVKPLDNETPV